SGIDILPTVVSVAAEEPETAAKTVQPTTLVWRSPPGSLAIHGARPLNMSSDNRVRKRISPIQMNIGSAVSAQELLEPHSVVPNSRPGGLPVKNASAT
ncbi:hypothetical protein COL154_014321, partial [Colletotrichum chrysophilum]